MCLLLKILKRKKPLIVTESKHKIGDVVSIVDNITGSDKTIAKITEIVITADGYRYNAMLGFKTVIVFDKEEYYGEFPNEITYSIVSTIGSVK